MLGAPEEQPRDKPSSLMGIWWQIKYFCKEQSVDSWQRIREWAIWKACTLRFRCIKKIHSLRRDADKNKCIIFKNWHYNHDSGIIDDALCGSQIAFDRKNAFLSYYFYFYLCLSVVMCVCVCVCVEVGEGCVSICTHVEVTHCCQMSYFIAFNFIFFSFWGEVSHWTWRWLFC